MMLSKYKAVIYDWDGTLTDSADYIVGAHNYVREKYNLEPWTKEDIFGCSSLSAREVYPQIYGDESDKALQILIDYTTKNNLTNVVLYDGAEEFLKFIQSHNLQQSVVSNKRHEPLNEVIDHVGWRNYFECAVGAGYCDRDKPAADPLLAALKLMKNDLTPADILYVGDTETDLACAKNAGCDVAFIQSDKQRPDLIEKYAPAYHCNDISELMPLLKQQEAA